MKGNLFTLMMLVQMAKTRGAEYNVVKDENKHDPRTTGRDVVHVWSPPTEGTLKANWDAAPNGKGGKMGMGVVIRNHDEELYAAKSMQFHQRMF
jgi:hypothetical protein